MRIYLVLIVVFLIVSCSNTVPNDIPEVDTEEKPHLPANNSTDNDDVPEEQPTEPLDPSYCENTEDCIEYYGCVGGGCYNDKYESPEQPEGMECLLQAFRCECNNNKCTTINEEI